MSLLNKFEKIVVDNTSRLDERLYKDLMDAQIKADNIQKEIDRRVSHLESYVSDTNPFKEFIEDTKNIASSAYYSFANNCFIKINEFYKLDTLFRDFLDRQRKDVYTLDEIIDYYFTVSGGVSLNELGKQKTKDDMFEKWDNRWRVPLPTYTKNGTLTLPKLVYICDSYHSELLRYDYNDDWKIEMLEKAISLYFNNENKNDNILREWNGASVEGSKFSYTDRYYKKGKVMIQKGGIEHVTMFATGNVKINFTDPTDARKFFEFFNLDKCTARE